MPHRAMRWLMLSISLLTIGRLEASASNGLNIAKAHLDHFDNKYAGEAEDYFTELHNLYEASEKGEARFYAALSLARYFLNSYPKLASEYLNSAENEIGSQHELAALVTFYRASIAQRDGQHEEVDRIVRQTKLQRLDRRMYAMVAEVQLQSLADRNEHKRLIQVYSEYSRRVSPRHRSDSVLKIASEAYLAENREDQAIKELSALAERYPFSDESAWALSQLMSRASRESKPYIFEERLLRALARNSTIDDNLKEFVLHALNGKVRGRDGRVRELDELSRLDLVVDFRFYDVALLLAESLEESTPSEDSRHPNLLLHLADLSSKAEKQEQALAYYQQYLDAYPWRNDRQIVRERMAWVHTRLHQFKEAAELFGDLARRSTRESLRWLHFWNTYRTGDYQAAAHLLERPGYVKHIDPQDNAPALIYWNGRVQERLGKADAAASAYAKVIKKYPQSFYSILVSGRLNRYLNGLDESPRSVEGALSEAAIMESLAERVRSLDPNHAAGPELAFESGAPGGQQDIVLASFDFDSHSLTTVNATTRAALVNHFKPKRIESIVTNYPLAFDDYTTKLSQELGLDRHMILSVMRAESRFNSDAVSIVGAQGLMQIMPYTGLRIAHLLDDEGFSVERLREPHVNLTYGQYYLSKLIDYYDGNAFLAIAAYNAGPDAVRTWLERCKGCEIDEFVEAITFRETRRYVKGVMGNLSIYKRIYDEEFAVHNWPSIPASLPDDDYIF